MAFFCCSSDCPQVPQRYGGLRRLQDWEAQHIKGQRQWMKVTPHVPQHAFSGGFFSPPTARGCEGVTVEGGGDNGGSVSNGHCFSIPKGEFHMGGLLTLTTNASKMHSRQESGDLTKSSSKTSGQLFFKNTPIPLVGSTRYHPTNQQGSVKEDKMSANAENLWPLEMACETCETTCWNEALVVKLVVCPGVKRKNPECIPSVKNELRFHSRDQKFPYEAAKRHDIGIIFVQHSLILVYPLILPHPQLQK